MKKILSGMPAVIVIAGMLTGSSLKVNAQAFTPNDNQVCFYEHDNYGGKYICLSSSGEIVDGTISFFAGTNTKWDNKISSVIIGKNACAIMYENPNSGGYCLTLRNKDNIQRKIPKLSAYGFNDKASHIKSLPYPQNLPPEPTFNQVFFFEHSNYDGYYMGLSYDRDMDNLTTLYFALSGSPNWNDKISSIKVGKYACATTWFNTNYKGQRNFFEADGHFTANYPDLAPSGIGDKISSFKLRLRGNCSME